MKIQLREISYILNMIFFFFLTFIKLFIIIFCFLIQQLIRRGDSVVLNHIRSYPYHIRLSKLTTFKKSNINRRVK
jgi:hypothetical protein